MEPSQTRTRASTSRPRRALLIGIDHYPLFLAEEQLKGCRNDVEMARHTLVDRGFDPTEITVLVDAEAERDSILAALRHLGRFAEASAAQGTIAEVFVHFSGHGSFTEDLKKDSDRTETLVPYDSGHRGHPNLDIPDIWIRDWLRWIGRSTDVVSLVFDSCYSGSTARGVFGSRKRGVAPAARPPEQVPEWWQVGRGIGHDGSPRYVLASACGARESAHEIDSANPSRPAYGAFSHHFYRALARAPGQARWIEVFELARLQVTAAFPTQHPQLEGDRQRPMAGAPSASGLLYVLVTNRDGDRVQLDAGAAHGLRAGSVWSIESPSTPPHSEDQTLARVEILDVGVTSAMARLLMEADPGSVRPGCRAIEIDRPTDAQGLRVHVDPGNDAGSTRGTTRELARQLSSAPGLLCTDSTDDADVQIVLRQGTESYGASSVGEWHATFPDGSPFGQPRLVTDPDAISYLVDNLGRWARYRRMIDLASRHQWAPCELRFLVEREQGWQEVLQTEDGDVCFAAGERMALKISNRGTEPIFPYLFHLGDQGEVILLDPVPGGHEVLAPGRSRTVGKGRRRLLATWTGGREYLQLFVGLSEIDLSYFIQTGIRGNASNRGVAIDDSQTWGTLVYSFRVGPPVQP